MNFLKKIIGITFLIWGIIITIGGLAGTITEKENKVGFVLMTVIFGILPLLGGVSILFKRKFPFLAKQDSSTTATISNESNIQAKEPEIPQSLNEKPTVKEAIPVIEKTILKNEAKPIKKSTIVNVGNGRYEATYEGSTILLESLEEAEKYEKNGSTGIKITDSGYYTAMYKGSIRYFHKRQDAEEYEKHGDAVTKYNEKIKPKDEETMPQSLNEKEIGVATICPNCGAQIVKTFFKVTQLVTLADGTIKCSKCTSISEKFKSNEFKEKLNEAKNGLSEATQNLFTGLAANNYSDEDDNKPAKSSQKNRPFFGEIKKDTKMKSDIAALKRCVTCDYWTGSRNIINSGMRVEYKDNHVNGTCIVKGSKYPTPRESGSGCSKWSKWRAFR